MPRKAKGDVAAALNIRVGSNIKLARTRRGMTQGDLAESIDVEIVTLSRIETGAQLPSLERLQNIADVLLVPLQALVATKSDSSPLIHTVIEVLGQLPEREQTFLCNFVLTYSQHLKEGQQR